MYTFCVEKLKTEGRDVRSSERHCEIFTTKFNLGFGTPRTDTCETCDGEDTTVNLENHLHQAELAQRKMKED